MNTKKYRNDNVSPDEWYTPAWITDVLGPFDLDPCSPENPPRRIAPLSYNKTQDGLVQPWPPEAFVWLNPPYSRHLLRAFCEKMADHGNGIALLRNHVDNLLFHEVIFPRATSILFMRRRVRFIRPDGTTGNPFFGSILVAFGPEADRRLKGCGIEGKYVSLG